MGTKDAVLSAAPPEGTRSKAAWLTEPVDPIPAHTAETPYQPAPAKVQAVADLATRYTPAVRRAHTAVRVAVEHRRTIGAPIARRRESHATHRGHKRTAASSPTSSSDPGDDSDGPEPAHLRVCAAPWCHHPVYGRKDYCGTERCDQARAAERQRKHRTGDLTSLERERLEDARAAHYVGSGAFLVGPAPEHGDPKPHSLSYLWKFGMADGTDPGELEALLNIHRACRCNGTHIAGGVVGCLKCGREREVVT